MTQKEKFFQHRRQVAASIFLRRPSVQDGVVGDVATDRNVEKVAAKNVSVADDDVDDVVDAAAQRRDVEEQAELVEEEEAAQQLGHKGPGVHLIKLFFPLLTTRPNKLERLSLASFSSQRPML